MSDSTQNRLIGIALLLASLPLVFWIEVDGVLGKIVSFGAGALLGLSLILVFTGEHLWDSNTWWARQWPLERG